MLALSKEFLSANESKESERTVYETILGDSELAMRFSEVKIQRAKMSGYDRNVR